MRFWTLLCLCGCGEVAKLEVVSDDDREVALGVRTFRSREDAEMWLSEMDIADQARPVECDLIVRDALN